LGTWTSILGTTAAFCTTIAFVPQLLKIRRYGGRDLSYPMLFLYVGGSGLWFTYGLMLRAGALIVANALVVALGSACIIMKWRHPGERGVALPPEADGQSHEKAGAAAEICDELSN